jgi:hypothetical protein
LLDKGFLADKQLEEALLGHIPMRRKLLAIIVAVSSLAVDGNAAQPHLGRSGLFRDSADVYPAEWVFHFQRRYAVEKQDRSLFIEKIRHIIEDGSVLGARPYIEYVRSYDQVTVFVTGFDGSSGSVASMIEVEASGDRDRYLVFSISTAVKPHLLTERVSDDRRDNDPGKLVVRKMEAAIFEPLGQ